MASDTRAPTTSNGKVREKVALKPGFHLRDWTKLMQVSRKMPVTSRKITLAELSQHTSTFDCWTAYKGKVYDISQYFPYHPGGEEILKQAAGIDCTELFNQYHRWVNIDGIIGKTQVGILDLSETEAPFTIPENEKEEDEEDSEEKESKLREEAINKLKEADS